MKIKDLTIPFLKDLKVDDDKIIDAILLPVNLSKTACQLNHLLGECTPNIKDEKRYDSLRKLHESCFQAKALSVNEMGNLHNSISIETMIEYKALQFLTQQYSSNEFNNLIEKYVQKSINEDNGVVIQNHYKNLAFLTSDIGQKRFPSEDIQHVNIEKVTGDYSINKNFPTKIKQQINFITSSLESVDSITLSAIQSFVGLKIKMTTDRISEQNKELDADLQHLHSQGYTNIKKSDLRANTQLKQIESVLKNHQIFEQAIKHTINYNNISNLCQNINNPELTDYINSLSKIKITEELIGTIKEGYRLKDNRFSPEMEYRQEEKAHEEYQILSIIQKDERRKDKDFQDSVADESFFHVKKKTGFSFTR